MEDLKEILAKKKITNSPKRESWQLEAVDAVNKLADGKDFKASIFKCYRQSRSKAKIALIDSLELGKPFSSYFFKVFNGLKKSANIKED